MPFTILTGGSFTSTGAGVQIPLPSSADYFKTWNITQSIASNPNTVISGEWFGSKFGAGQSAAGRGIQIVKTTANLTSQFGAGLGFTYVSTPPQPEAAVTGTAITAATPAVVASTNTYSEGDYVTLYATTGMLQISGMTFQISSVSGSGYTLLGLPAAGFAAAATALISRRVAKTMPVEPRTMFITAISQAVNAEITFSEAHSYVAGQLVHFSVPASFGMKQMDQLTGRVISATGSNSPAGSDVYKLTVNIDTSAFTAFAFPASSGSPTTTLFATMSPAGQQVINSGTPLVQVGYNFNYAPFHSGQFVPYMYLAGGAQSPAGANADVVNWMAYKLEN